MSRRRAPREPRFSDETHVDVRIVCTGRRTHEVVSFGEMRVNRSSGTTIDRLKVSEYFVGIDLERVATLKTIPFVCRRCSPRRNFPIKRENLDRICRDLVDADTLLLDLSALDASTAFPPISS